MPPYAFILGLAFVSAVSGCRLSPPEGRKTWKGPFSGVAAGSATCAIGPGGAAKCWGTELRAPTPTGSFRAIAVAQEACGISINGDVTCWGNPTMPRPPQGRFLAIAVGHDACGVREDGSLVCWPLGEATFCVPSGDGGTTCRPVTRAPYEPFPNELFLRVAIDASNIVAVRTDGTLRVTGPAGTLDRDQHWGAPSRATPPSGAWVDAAAGGDFFCALAANGSVACWSDAPRPEMQPPLGVHFMRLAARGNTACGVDDRGEIPCWGEPMSWYGITYAPPRGSFDDVAVGDHHVCAHARDNRVLCWGADQQGQVTGEPPSLWFRN